MPTYPGKVFAFLFPLLFLQAAEAKIEAILGNITFKENPNLAFLAPETPESEIIISREQFVISYNKFKRTPNWVAWKLETKDLGPAKRSNNFKIDAELEKYLSTTSDLHAVNFNEFKGSCFDRGHQTPSADRTSTQENNSATFVMSNMAPQTPYLNRVVWSHLEEYTRQVVTRENTRAYIISGPIYDEDFGSIGPHKDIAVPSKEFKLVAFFSPEEKIQSLDQAKKIIAVIMPNTLASGERPLDNQTELCRPLTVETTNKNDWTKYLSSVEEIEKLSGMTFSKHKLEINE